MQESNKLELWHFKSITIFVELLAKEVWPCGDDVSIHCMMRTMLRQAAAYAGDARALTQSASGQTSSNLKKRHTVDCRQAYNSTRLM